MSRVLIEGCVEAGLFLAAAEVTATDLVLRANRPTAGGALGDGADVIGGSLLSVNRALIEDNARAGVNATGGTVVLRSTQLSCNPIHLNSERLDQAEPSTITDDGHNACGCEGVSVLCAVESSVLAPPEPPSLPLAQP
jgi:hypothetical protein